MGYLVYIPWYWVQYLNGRELSVAGGLRMSLSCIAPSYWGQAKAASPRRGEGEGSLPFADGWHHFLTKQLD